MKIFFSFFILFILLVLELWAGTIGIYLPLAWMGFFYFFCAGFKKSFLFMCGLTGALICDLLLFHRILLPDVCLLILTIYFSWRYNEFWRKSILRGGIFAFILLPSAYIFQFISSLWTQNFSWQQLSDTAAHITALVPLCFCILCFEIYTLDILLKKLKLNTAFVVQFTENHFSLYHRGRKRD